MLCDDNGRPLETAAEVAKRAGVDVSYIRRLNRTGQLHTVVKSPRRVFYYPDEVERLAKEKAKARKKRGGRPPKGDEAA